MNLELQRILIGDGLRNKKLDQALRKMIKKNDGVLDLGAGTGLLGFLALRHGAAKVIFVEERATLEFAVSMARRLGLESRCEFLHMHSSEVKLRRQVDVLICETLGNFAFEEHILDTVEDGKKWLKPGGRIIPSKIVLWVVPVVSSALQKKIDVWSSQLFDFPMDELRTTSLNRMYSEEVPASSCLKNHRQLVAVDLASKTTSRWYATVDWKIKHSVKVYGFCIYWESVLAPGIQLSTSPWQPKTHWKQIYLPLLGALNVPKGSRLELKLDSDTRLDIGVHVKWSGHVSNAAGDRLGSFSMDTDIGRVGEF